MKRVIFVFTIFLLVSFVFAQDCPSKTTSENTSITFVGRITSLGNDEKVFVWFEYGENPANLTKTEEEMKAESGIFCIKVKNLKPCTKYFYRAVIRNKEGTSYGGMKEIKTNCDFNIKSQDFNVIFPSSEILLNKCSSDKLSFFVVNNTSVGRKISLWPEGEISDWFNPRSLNFVLPGKSKRKITWKVNIPCDSLKNSYQVSLKLKNKENIFYYPVLVNIKTSSFNLHTR